ncbi:MAG: hypothetical protein HGA65_13400, partial [Oscillochloris sp.]|nr:hypothetical protein [Oscillochloris sp.]
EVLRAESILGLGDLAAVTPPSEGVGPDVLRARLEALLGGSDEDEEFIGEDESEGEIPADEE